jgi:hypothetical protein
MHNMFHSRTDVVIMRRKKHLGFMLEAAICLRMKNSCVIALKFRSDFVISSISLNLTFICLFPFRIIRAGSYIIKGILHFPPLSYIIL